VLKTLHDELDKAVPAAYGWGDLATRSKNQATAGDIKAESPQRLVTLNQRRALEKAAGPVRWLRPSFQNSISKTELSAQLQQSLDVDLASNSATRPQEAAMLDTVVLSELRKTRPHPGVLAYLQAQNAEAIFMSVSTLGADGSMQRAPSRCR